MLFFLGYKKSRRDENGSRSIQKNKREVEQGLEVKSDEKKKSQQPGFVRLEATSIITRKAIRADLCVIHQISSAS